MQVNSRAMFLLKIGRNENMDGMWGLKVCVMCQNIVEPPQNRTFCDFSPRAHVFNIKKN